MPITTIPVPYQQGLAKIKQLSPADLETIVAALEKAPAAGGLKEVTRAVIQQVPSLERGDVESILRTLYSLCVLLTDEETPLSEHLSELTNAMQATGKLDLALSGQEKIELEKRLSRLLKVNTITISSKVQRLRLEYPNTLHDAMILTDIRPIFDKPEERPVGCTLAHTLKIVYHEGGEHKEFYVVMDADDLVTMKKVIQRAEAKASSLRSILKLASLPDLS